MKKKRVGWKKEVFSMYGLNHARKYCYFCFITLYFGGLLIITTTTTTTIIIPLLFYFLKDSKSGGCL
jgi:hypothetical protein